MAIKTQLYSENLGFPFAAGDDGGGNSSQDWMENACGINDFYLFNLQQQQYHQSQQQQPPPPKNQDLYSENGFSINVNNNNNKTVSMHSHIQKQNQEIEGFISLQNERLRLALEAHRKQQVLTILKKYELKTEFLLRQKDEEIKRATSRRIELEQLLRRTDMERQAWQMAAKEKEVMVMNLNNTIEQLRENWKKEVEDEGSCCHGEEDDDDHENNNNNNNNSSMRMICKSCFCADSCVVMLPCRHLCSCKSCDAFLHSCPVCKMVKKASIQLSLSDSNL